MEHNNQAQTGNQSKTNSTNIFIDISLSNRSICSILTQLNGLDWCARAHARGRMSYAYLSNIRVHFSEEKIFVIQFFFYRYQYLVFSRNVEIYSNIVEIQWRWSTTYKVLRSGTKSTRSKLNTQYIVKWYAIGEILRTQLFRWLNDANIFSTIFTNLENTITPIHRKHPILK